MMFAIKIGIYGTARVIRTNAALPKKIRSRIANRLSGGTEVKGFIRFLSKSMLAPINVKIERQSKS